LHELNEAFVRMKLSNPIHLSVEVCGSARGGGERESLIKDLGR